MFILPLLQLSQGTASLRWLLYARVPSLNYISQSSTPEGLQRAALSCL